MWIYHSAGRSGSSLAHRQVLDFCSTCLKTGYPELSRLADCYNSWLTYAVILSWWCRLCLRQKTYINVVWVASITNAFSISLTNSSLLLLLSWFLLLQDTEFYILFSFWILRFFSLKDNFSTNVIYLCRNYHLGQLYFREKCLEFLYFC